MGATYEFWLLDDAGRRIALLKDFSFFSYSRTTHGVGTLNIGHPYELFRAQVEPVFKLDRRIDVWRSPEIGIPSRREGMFLIRSQRIYTRETDNVTMIIFYANSGIDLLDRRVVLQPDGSDATYKSGTVDDIMKRIVREQFLFGATLDANGDPDNTRAFPNGEFSVQADLGLGPDVAIQFANRRVLDVLKELKDTSFQYNILDYSLYRKIYFDVVPMDLQGGIDYILDEDGVPLTDEYGQPFLDETSIGVVLDGAVGWQFQTYVDLYGIDRTAGVVFSVENNNLLAPEFYESHIGAVNTVVVKGYGRGDSRPIETAQDSDRANASRWNRVESFLDASQEPDQDNLIDYGYAQLYLMKPTENITCTFLNIGETPGQPRSLYGVDWDLGDLLPVKYVGRLFNVEVQIVYVSMDDEGNENVEGKNSISNEGEA